MIKIVLITEATREIGKATAMAFSKMNINLILCGRNSEVLKELKKVLAKQVAVTTLNFDVRDKVEVFSIIESLPEAFKNIDIRINKAGNAHGPDLVM